MDTDWPQDSQGSRFDVLALRVLGDSVHSQLFPNQNPPCVSTQAKLDFPLFLSYNQLLEAGQKIFFLTIMYVRALRVYVEFLGVQT